MNSRPTFVQESRFGRVIFQIRDGSLFISSRSFVGQQIEDRLDLRSLNPDYEARAIRIHLLLVIPLVGCLLCAVVMWGLWHQDLVPWDALSIFRYWSVMGFAVCLFWAIRGTPRVFFYAFKNQWGKPALNLIRESKQAAECDAFLVELVAHIELAQSGVSETERSRVLDELKGLPGGSLGVSPDADKWKVSIGLGALATGFPLIPGVIDYLGGLTLPIVFLLCVGGMGFTVYSFQNSEPRRWWSLIGAVLSLIPPFFY